jgi:pre-mRNA-splicing factor 18
MDFLKAEIERKKRQLQEKQIVGPGKKYFKRGDLIEKERQEYLDRHKPKQDDVKNFQVVMDAKEKNKSKLLEKKPEHLEVPALPRIEVIRRLRERMEPIFLYGESEVESCDRLRSIEVNEPDHSEGIKNDFKEAMDKVEKVLDQETAQGSSKGEQSKNESDLYECLIVYDELIDMIPEANKGDMDADVKIVSEFIKFMMTKWHQALSKRSPDEQSSVMGKRETGIHTQTRTYLKPLLRMLKKQTVTDDVRDSLVKMVVFTLQKDYIFGHEAYMEMAVGNAPWPIGVTNAGIHARPARENIFSKNVAHVLNDETQRKYIQGLKRLMTKAQVYYPTDPSRSIDYVRKEQSTTTNTD